MKGLSRWVTVGVAAIVLVGALSIDPVRSFATDALRALRIKQVQVVHFDPAEVEQLARALQASGQQVDLANLGTFKNEPLDGSTLVDAGTATINGARITIPDAIGTYKRDEAARLSQGTRLKATPKVAGINSLLASLGSTASLPESLNGQTFTLDVPGIVSATFTEPGTGNQLSLRRSLSPTLTVPAGVDVEQVRGALLSIPILPDGMRNTLAGIDINGGTMLIPDFGLASHGASVANVTVNGNPGVMITLPKRVSGAGTQVAPAGGNLLIWAQDGVWNCLGGTFTLEQGLTFAAALN